MNQKIRKSLALAAGVSALIAAPALAQFNHYVALGDSLTAGVEGNCLVERNQAGLVRGGAGRLSFARRTFSSPSSRNSR